MMNRKLLLSLIIISLLSCGGGGGGSDNITAPADQGDNTNNNNSVEFTSTKILTELFTSTTCGPCTSQNNALDQYLDSSSSTYTGDIADKWIILRYHVWWPSSGDPYYDWNPSPVVEREGYYREGTSNYVPHAYTQGLTDSGSNASTWRTDARAIDIVTKSSPFDIDMDVNLNGNTISGTVEVQSATDVKNDLFKLYIVISHDYSEYSAPNGQTVFHQVFIDFVTSGELLSLSSGESITKNINWTLDSNWPNDSGVSWDASDLNILAFVQYDGSGPVYRKIYQVEEVDFGS